MAFVALQFEENQILVAGARSNAKRLQVHSLFEVPISGSDLEAAESLKAALAEHGLTRSEAIIVVNRADVEMRELTIPPAPDDEVPDMVRFVARNEFASLNENWALDYLPLSGDASTSRSVLAVGVSPEALKQQKKVASDAGLKIRHIVLRPFASIDLLRARLTGDESRLVLDPNGDQIDMTIVHGDSVVTTRTVRIPQAYDANQRAESLLSEVRRTLASSRKSLGENKITQVIMYGQDESNKQLAGNLRGQLNLEIEFVQPSSLAPMASGVNLPEHDQRYAALLGALVQQTSQRRHSIDFANPRKPVIVKNDYSKWYLWSGITAAAALFLILLGWWVLSSQAGTIAEYETKLQSLVEMNNGTDGSPSSDQLMAEIEKIDEWKSADVNWLKELNEYSKRSLTPDDAIVDSIDAVAPLRKGTSPRIMVATRIDNVDKEKALNEALQARPYEVKPTRWTDSGDESYPLSSSLTVTFEQRRAEVIKAYDQRALEFIQNKVQQASEESESDSSQ